MSTIVYQELQSSFNESCFIDSRTLSLKLNSSLKHCQTTRNSFHEISSSSKHSNNTCSSFSSIEALSGTKKQKEESVYVHPLVKQSSFMLSDKSLEMCTESLGSETGSCDIESGVFFPSTEERQPRQKIAERVKREVVIDQGKFPPPLTTMTGSNPIQVKPYRDNGRLVIEAVSSPPIQSYMQAERSDGRLKLTLVSEDFSDDDIILDDGITSLDDQGDSFDCQNNKNGNYSVITSTFVEKDVVEENNEKDESEGRSKGNAYLLEDDVKNGKKVEFGVKLGLGKIQKPSRCKERGQGNKRLINWKPFWVAT